MYAGKTDEVGLPEALAEANAAALANRPCSTPGYSFVPAAMRDERFHELRRKYPYFGYVGVKVESIPPVAMLSNNDDRVAQCYFFFGHDAFESFSMRAWCTLAGSAGRIFDVGAFSGVYSLVAARANPKAKVHALEPMERTFWRLSDNIRANRMFRQIEASWVAAGDEDGQAELNVYRGVRALGTGSSLVAKQGREVSRTQPVDTVRLDIFARERSISAVDLVKLDVELYEVRAVRGMAGLLGERKPVMLIEVFSAEGLREIRDILSPHGYSFAVLDERVQRAYVEDAHAHDQASNVLFWPGPPEELRAFCDEIAPLS